MSFITKMVCFLFISKWQPLDKLLLLLLFLLALSTMVFLHSPVFSLFPWGLITYGENLDISSEENEFNVGSMDIRSLKRLCGWLLVPFGRGRERPAELLQASRAQSRSPGRYTGLRRAVSSPLLVGHLTVCKYMVEGSSGGGENINEAACPASAIDCGEVHA